MRKLKFLTIASGINGKAEAFKDENLIVGNTVLAELFNMATAADREVVKELVMEHFGAEAAKPADATEGDRWAWSAAAMGRTLKVRHGAMFVNVSADDEGACAAAAEEAAKAAGTSTVRMEGNMSVSLDEFIGKMDGEEWSEGAFTKALREANEKKAWLVVVCGGDVPSAKFEALNTLLDDNKLLTLETGEKIRLAPEVRIIFVSKACDNMSPASVSRLGMVWSE